MLILPAIDIIEGGCVRLTQGDYGKISKYGLNPFDAAKKFVDDGASILHIVDLDAAKNGESENISEIIKIAESGIRLQVGGGIRTYEKAKYLLENGIERVIFGTVLIENSELIRRVIEDFGADRVAVSLDMKNGKIMIEGWQKYSIRGLDEAVILLKSLGVEIVIITDIARDGMLCGPNFESAKELIAAGLKVIVSGGVSNQKDIEIADKIGAYGCIVGKAIYEGKFNLRSAIRKAKNGLAKRIIPCMDICERRVKKGINFKNLRDAGDPVELAKLYSDMGADELIFLDITATVEKRKTFCSLVGEIAKNINIPFTVGGGIQNLEDIRRLLNNGADKVAICSYAVKNPGFIQAAAEQFGSQCVVVSIDAKKSASNKWEVYINGGRLNTEIDVIEFAKKMEQLGAGELLVNSLDCDGMKKGYDIELLKAISAAVNIPIIASSGAGSKQDFLAAFNEGFADAALAASIFHSQELSIPELKKYLSTNNITIRI